MRITSDDAEISIVCTGPRQELMFDVHGMGSSGDGEGKSPNFQINVYTNPSPGVLFLGVRDPVSCTASINSKYRITGGRIDVNPTNIYTDRNHENIPKPPTNVLFKHVTATVGQAQTNSIPFRLTVPNDQYKGTINVIFVVFYKPVA